MKTKLLFFVRNWFLNDSVKVIQQPDNKTALSVNLYGKVNKFQAPKYQPDHFFLILCLKNLVSLENVSM